MTTTPMDFSTSVSLPDPSFSDCLRIVSELEEHDWKPCITLVRYGVIPKPSDTILWAKLTETLLLRFYTFNKDHEPVLLTLDGLSFFSVSTNPILSSMLLSMLLARIPSTESICNSRTASVSKELSVMESTPRTPAINWSVLFYPHLRKEPMYSGGVSNPIATDRIRASFRKFRNNLDLKIIWPHSTMRGISENTTREYLGRTIHLTKPWLLNEESSDRPVSSRDIVANYLHNGFWIHGDCELKQRWYPSILTPRTYFAQGGDAIRVSAYLREFFNELCDVFLPTERHARVDGSRLVTYDHGFFFIYDLTSFTSNFHEQYSFLMILSEFFRGTTVLLVSTGLGLIPHDLGDLIEEYANVINLNPRYRLSTKLFDLKKEDSLYLTHHIAGFLGVPGNLATCTLAHGSLISMHFDSHDRQSCAGDDGCAACRDRAHRIAIEKSIRMIGIFQPEKGSTTEMNQAASYLKRRFIQNGRTAALVSRIEYPLLALVNAFNKPDPRFPEISLDRKKIRSSIAKAVVSFIRSCFELTNGLYLTGELECILDFLTYVYQKADLPKGGQVRGMLYDDADVFRKVNDSVVFPLDRIYLENDPDELLVERFMPWVVNVPEFTEVTIFDYQGDWFAGEDRACQMNGGLEQLVKYGWVTRQQSKKRTLVGIDARRYFRRLLREEIRDLEYTYTAKSDLTSLTLMQLGVTDPARRLKKGENSSQHTFTARYKDFDLPLREQSELDPILAHTLAHMVYDD